MLRETGFKIRHWGIIIPLFFLCSHGLCAQSDSLTIVGGDVMEVTKKQEKIHSPHKATLYSAILPGLGQVYNKKYWKVPIVYGGIATAVYFISFNSDYYNLYKNAYRDFIIRDPANTSYEQIILEKTNYQVADILNDATKEQWFTTTLKNKKTYYKRYRDLSYIMLIGVYVLNLIDASVDAHFFNYDVSNDLSMNIQPMMLPANPENYAAGSNGVGLQLTLNF